MPRPSKANSVDNLFPDKHLRGKAGWLKVADLPYLSRPVIEGLHDIQPDVIIAADRGARLLALSVVKGWKRRYPDEKLPTMDGKIHFARVTSRSASPELVTEAVHKAFSRAGLQPVEQDGQTRFPKIAYLDDWVVEGTTINRFVDATKMYGIPPESVHYFTMCRGQVYTVNHTVADPERSTNWSEWDTRYGDDRNTLVGVRYMDEAPTTPIADVNEAAIDTRIYIDNAMNSYYRKFSASNYAGSVSVGNMVTLPN